MIYQGSDLFPYLFTGVSWGLTIGLLSWLTGFGIEHIVKLFKNI